MPPERDYELLREQPTSTPLSLRLQTCLHSSLPWLPDTAAYEKREFRLMPHWRTFLVLGIVAFACTAQAKQLAVIIDRGNSTANISASDLEKIFNAHTRSWPDGKTIKIVLRDPTSADMQLVVRKLFNMSADQARAFVRSHPEMIVVADSDEAVIHLVANTRGAIGLIDLYSLTKDVNVVKIDGKLPVEQGYLLRGN